MEFHLPRLNSILLNRIGLDLRSRWVSRDQESRLRRFVRLSANNPSSAQLACVEMVCPMKLVMVDSAQLSSVYINACHWKKYEHSNEMIILGVILQRHVYTNGMLKVVRDVKVILLTEVKTIRSLEESQAEIGLLAGGCILDPDNKVSRRVEDTFYGGFRRIVRSADEHWMCISTSLSLYNKSAYIRLQQVSLRKTKQSHLTHRYWDPQS